MINLQFSAVTLARPRLDQSWFQALLGIPSKNSYSVLPSYIQGEPSLYLTQDDKAYADSVSVDDPTFKYAYQSMQRDVFDKFCRRGIYENSGGPEIILPRVDNNKPGLKN